MTFADYQEELNLSASRDHVTEAYAATELDGMWELYHDNSPDMSFDDFVEEIKNAKRTPDPQPTVEVDCPF